MHVTREIRGTMVPFVPSIPQELLISCGNTQNAALSACTRGYSSQTINDCVTQQRRDASFFLNRYGDKCSNGWSDSQIQFIELLDNIK